MTALLKLQGVRAGYGPTRVLHGVSMSIEQGDIVALLGANGAGKTTTLRAITGGVRWDGAISFGGRSLRRFSTEDIVRLGIAHVPDGRGTFVHLTVEENLVLGAYTRRDRAAVAQDFERMYGIFPRLKERATQQAGTLSGGEQQMLAIARALMLKPKLLLLDEPSFGLAPLVVQEIFSILRRINEEDNISVLLVEQNANLALGVCQSGYVLEVGRVALAGDRETIRCSDIVKRAYLGG
jgi:branched-chain amino acid transport system ATP-binding protein